MNYSKLDEVIKDWKAVLSRDPMDITFDLIDDTLELLKKYKKDRELLDKYVKQTEEFLHKICANCKYMDETETCICQNSQYYGKQLFVGGTCRSFAYKGGEKQDV